MITYILLLCVIHSLLILYDSVWLIALVSNERDYNVVNITALYQFVVPLIKIIEALLITQVENYKCSDGSLEEHISNRHKLFLTKRVPNVQISHFVCLRDLEWLVGNLYIR